MALTHCLLSYTQKLLPVLHNIILPTSLCMPQPRDSLGDTNVICLEGVQGDAEGDGSDAEGPHGDGADEGNARSGEVVDDARLEADVGVHYKKSTKDRVGQWVKRSSGERCNRQRDKAGGDNSVIVSVYHSLLGVSPL
jgi:hypothetical protein